MNSMSEFAPTPSETEGQMEKYIYKSNAAKNLSILIQEGVFKNTGAAGWREAPIDYERAEEILEPISTRQENLEFSQEEAEMSMRKSIKAFVDNEVISAQDALLTGKILRPSNIEPGKDISFTYTDSDFPVSPEKRAKLSTESRSLGDAREFLKPFLDIEQIELTDEQLNEVILRWVCSHEYAHGFEQAKIIQMAKSSMKDEEEGVLKVEVARVEVFTQEQLINTIAPEAEITDVFDPKNIESPMDPRYSGTERFAVGFELLGLKYALKDAGVPDDKATNVVKGIEKDYRDAYQDLTNLVALAKEKGFDDFEDFIKVYNEFHQTISKQFLKTHLLDKIPATNLGAEYAGYSFPLNEEQLKKYISILEYKTEDQILRESRQKELKDNIGTILSEVGTDNGVFEGSGESFLFSNLDDLKDGKGHWISYTAEADDSESGREVYRTTIVSVPEAGKIEMVTKDQGYTYEDFEERTGKKADGNSQSSIKTIWTAGENPKLEKMILKIHNDQDLEPDCVVSIDPKTGLVDSLSLDRGMLDSLKALGFNLNEQVFKKQSRGNPTDPDVLYSSNPEDFAVYNEGGWNEIVAALDTLLETKLARGVDVKGTVKKTLESPGNIHTVKKAFVPKLVYKS